MAFLLNLAREIVKDAEDFEGDNAFGMQTLPVVVGMRFTKMIITGILLLLSSHCCLPISVLSRTSIHLDIYPYADPALDDCSGTGIKIRFPECISPCKYNSEISHVCRHVVYGGSIYHYEQVRMSYLRELDRINSYDIILASRSPRRQHLLKELGISFRVAAEVEIDEVYPSTLSGQDIPLYLAREKARHYHSRLDRRSILITADTIVWYDNRVMPKPRDLIEARLF